MAGKYEIKRASSGQFFFNLKAANGEIARRAPFAVARKVSEKRTT